jgi:type IV pilus assembly protein PilE
MNILSARHHHRAAGFTLVEMLAVLSVAGVLSSVAYPSFQGQLQKARRSDALVSLTIAQSAQERWRANNCSYGSLADIGVAAVSVSRHYAIELVDSSTDGHALRVNAAGSQRGDTQCATMTLRVAGANTVYSSGPDADTVNSAADNRRCWAL